ncbi:MAG: phytoene desaturase [Planctomycetes bacterium]|nr:phytoene desaturase [Planctomycetota bacterium]
MKSRPTAVIVGGGLAGLACAVELTTAGFAVTIVEKNSHLGGKMNVLEERGFRFDMGPTILTLPDVLRGVIRRSGRRVEDYLELVRLDPQWRCFYEDGTTIDLLSEVAEMKSVMDRQFPGSDAGAGWEKFVAWSRRMYRLSERVFFYKDLQGIGDLIRKPPPREPGMMGDVLAMRMHSTLAATAHRFIPESHLRQLAEHFLQYVGSSPFLAPAILGLIAAAQVDHGCWYSMGGTRSVARSLERILREENATLLHGVGVKVILEEGGRAIGVELEDGRRITADVVVSNCDVQRTYRDLVQSPRGAREQERIARNYAPACSGVVLYLGLDRQYDHLLHHNFMFSRDSSQEFQDIYAAGNPARDPSLYVCVPSRTDDRQAPDGCEALYVLVHTAHLRERHHWEGPGGLFEQYRPVIMEKLKRFGMPDLEKHIVVERHLTPASIERLYNAEGGAIYGLASHGRLRGGFKPRNRSRVLRHLYLAGGSTNPGPGVPMVLMSGVTAARAIGEDFGIAMPKLEAPPTAAPPAPVEALSS